MADLPNARPSVASAAAEQAAQDEAIKDQGIVETAVEQAPRETEYLDECARVEKVYKCVCSSVSIFTN